MSIRKYEDMIRTLEQFQGAVGRSDQADRSRKRRRIVEVATELFIRHGYRKTSVDDVADKAGIAKGTVYLYFKTKADLLAHAIVDEKLRYAEAIRPIFDPDVPARERLRRFITIGFRLAAEMPLTSSLLGGNHELLAAMQDMDPALIRESQERNSDFLADLVAAAAGHDTPNEEHRARAAVMLELTTAVMIAGSAWRKPQPMPRFGEVLADMLIDGLASEKAAPVRSPNSKARR